MSYRQTVDFLLYDWLDVESLASAPRFADHSRETFDSVLDTCEQIAREKYAPFNRLADTEEPWFDGEKVHLPQASHAAARAYFESGMLAAAQDYEIGGMQLPCVVEMAANSFFSKAGIGIGGGGMLTSGNANLLMVHGTPMQQEVFAKNEFAGRFSGTMCLSEPQAGSSLSDIVTARRPDGADFESDPLGPRYRLRGNKMWISNGEHELTENIVHLVLAKIPGADGKLVPGTRGISLFIVPKKLVDADGELTGERNDVALAGLNHKLGYRGIPNTLLNFGEGKFPVRGATGAIGYLVGRPGEGLRCMFHMMNEARIAVGLGATMLGYAGYEASLDYAKTRPQGRPIGPGGKDAAQPQVPIIEHADVKRMLLAQKSYCEGALALELYCARLVDELHTGDEAAKARRARAAARSADADRQELAERVVPRGEQPGDPGARRLRLHARLSGRAVLARQPPQHDPRGHARHPGARPARPQGRDGRRRRARRRPRGDRRDDRAGGDGRCAGRARERADGGEPASRRGDARRLVDRRPEEALANATPYLQAFGHVVLAWIWLDVAICAARRPRPTTRARPARRLPLFLPLRAARRSAPGSASSPARDDTCRTMAEESF